MKKVLLCLALLLVLYPSISHGGLALSDEQMFVLDVARSEGTRIDYPETIQGIGYVESKCGKYKHGPPAEDFSDRYFGSYQIKISTVRYIYTRIKEEPILMSDKQIMTRLIVDDVWSAELATDYLGYLLNKFKNYPNPWSHAVLAYNRGPGTVKKRGLSHDPYDYVENVKRAIRKVVRPYNKFVMTVKHEKSRTPLIGIRLVNNVYTNVY